jgi:hypothetical protein
VPDPLRGLEYDLQIKYTPGSVRNFNSFACDGFLETSSGPFGAFGPDGQRPWPRRWAAALLRPESGAFDEERHALWHRGGSVSLPGALVLWDISAGVPMLDESVGRERLHGFALSYGVDVASAIASATFFSCIQPAPAQGAETQARWPEMGLGFSDADSRMAWRAVRIVALVLTSRTDSEEMARRYGYSAVFSYMTARAVRGDAGTLCQPYNGEAVPKIYNVVEKKFLLTSFLGWDLSGGIQKLIVMDSVTFRKCGAGVYTKASGRLEVCDETRGVYPAAPVENTLGLFICVKHGGLIAFHWVAITFLGPTIDPDQQRFHVADSHWGKALEPTVDLNAWAMQSLRSGGLPRRESLALSYPYLRPRIATAKMYGEVQTVVLPGDYSGGDIIWPVVVIATRAPSLLAVGQKFDFKKPLNYYDICHDLSESSLQCRIAGLDPSLMGSPACRFSFSVRVDTRGIKITHVESTHAGTQLFVEAPPYELWSTLSVSRCRSDLYMKGTSTPLAPLSQPGLALHVSEFSPRADGTYMMRQINRNIDARDMDKDSLLAGGWTVLSLPAPVLQQGRNQILLAQQFGKVEVQDVQFVQADRSTNTLTILVRYTISLPGVSGGVDIQQLLVSSESHVVFNRAHGTARVVELPRNRPHE